MNKRQEMEPEEHASMLQCPKVKQIILWADSFSHGYRVSRHSAVCTMEHCTMPNAQQSFYLWIWRNLPRAMPLRRPKLINGTAVFAFDTQWL